MALQDSSEVGDALARIEVTCPPRMQSEPRSEVHMGVVIAVTCTGAATKRSAAVVVPATQKRFERDPISSETRAGHDVRNARSGRTAQQLRAKQHVAEARVVDMTVRVDEHSRRGGHAS